MRFKALLLSLFILSCREKTEIVPTACPSGNSCGSGIGECRYGSIFCDEDGGSQCIGAVEPSLEVCDGLDNDCDGLVDNHVTDALGSCSTECQPGGVMVCERGALSCIAIQNPKPETCDDKDNDCNGVVDDIVWDGGIYCYTGPPNTAGNGGCHPGVWRCRDRTVDCNGQALPSFETCDGTDENCNGLIDDGITCAGGPGAARDLHVQITWNDPNDVDTHLRNANTAWGVPTDRSGWQSSPWDCFYANQNPLWSTDTDENPHLAFDDVVGPGPEHLRIAKMATDGGYDIGVHLYSWKSGTTPAHPIVKVFCGGRLIVTRDRDLQNRDFWYVGRIQYTALDPCHFEDAPDGGLVF